MESDCKIYPYLLRNPAITTSMFETDLMETLGYNHPDSDSTFGREVLVSAT